MEGWIKLWRKIRENEIWAFKPWSFGQAWAEMVMCAKFSDCAITFQGNVFDIKRGQLVTTLRQLSRDFGWGDHRVKRYIELLKKRRMIDAHNDAGCIIVTICRYDTYQGSDSDSTHQYVQSRRTDDALTTHDIRREEGEEEKKGEEAHETRIGASESNPPNGAHPTSPDFIDSLKKAIPGSSPEEEVERQLFQLAKRTCVCPAKDDTIRRTIRALRKREDVGTARLQQYLMSRESVGRHTNDWLDHFKPQKNLSNGDIQHERAPKIDKRY